MTLSLRDLQAHYGEALASNWRRQVARTGYVSLTASEVGAEFRRLAEGVLECLLADIDSEAVARDIGARLVHMGFAAPEALAATMHVLCQFLGELSREYPDVLHGRWSILIGAIAAGFSASARERLLTQQEATRTAVFIELRRASEALRRQAMLLDLAPDAILVRTLDARIAFWNRGAEELYGWTREQAVGAVSHDLLQTEFPGDRLAIERDVVRDGHWEGELIQRRRDGSTIVVDSRWAVQVAEGDAQPAILEINTDITRRKQIEATLREREANLETAQSLAHLGSWEWNVRTNAGYWSPELYRLLGYADGEVEPRVESFLEAVHPDDIGAVSQVVQQAFEGGTHIIEHRTSGRDGSQRLVQSQSELVRDASGQPLRLFGTVLDITERRRLEAERLQLLAEQAARAEAEAAQERVAFLAEASTRLASSLDLADTLRNVARVFVPRLADASTVDVLNDEEILHVATWTNDADFQSALERTWAPSVEGGALRTVLQTGTALSFDSTDFDDNGFASLAELGVRSIMLVPLPARGRVLGALTCLGLEGRGAPTAAELALAEELGRRCGLAIDNARLHAEAQRATRLRDEFLSVAAHELKTPMTTLRGYAQLLDRLSSSGVAPAPGLLAKSVLAINAQSDKLVALTEQLLDVSRIEAGKLRVDKKPVDLGELVRAVVEAVQATTTRHVLTLEVRGSSLAHVDPMRFDQVVTNLIGNAVKYSPNGGPVEVAISSPDPRTLELSVRDWGLGIPPDRRENLFDRFYQAHGEGHFGGLGLGLYVSRQIVETHGGSITADFPSDGGSRFVVRLPVEPAQPPA